MMMMVVMMTRDLGKGGKGGVKTIRCFWLNHSVVETRVDWVPGVDGWVTKLVRYLGCEVCSKIIGEDSGD